MKSMMRVAVFIALGMVAVVSLYAWQTNQTNQFGVHPTKEIVQTKRLTKEELFSQDHTADVVAIRSIWWAYAYYNDTHNGPGMASLFTPDAVVHFVRADLGVFQGGQNGGGCRLTGRKQIATYYGFNRTGELLPDERDGLPFPASSHHMNSNALVKVSDDGKTAMLTSTLLYTATSNGGSRMANDGKGSRIADSGTYRNFFRKTSDGWEISEVYDAGDPHAASFSTASRPPSSPSCGPDGPIPGPSAAADAIK